MNPRAVLRTAILAVALAAGVSCKTPLVEGPASVRTSQRHVQPSHPCTTRVIKGGRHHSCHILFQTHKNMITNTISESGVRSQILLYHVLSDLIRNYGVHVVLLEGAEIWEDVRESLSASYGKKRLNDVWSIFGKCMGSEIQTDHGITSGMRLNLPGVLGDHADVNFCLAKTIWHDPYLAGFSKLFLIFKNPHIFFTGVERDRKVLYKKLKRYKLLMKLKEPLTSLLGQLAGEGHQKHIVSLIEELVKKRNAHVERDAIKQALRHSSQNTALVMGVGHEDPIESVIRKIPFHKRPTFYFVMPECQGNPDFSISPQTLDLAARTSGVARAKQNL